MSGFPEGMVQTLWIKAEESGKSAGFTGEDKKWNMRKKIMNIPIFFKLCYLRIVISNTKLVIGNKESSVKRSWKN